MEQRDANLRDLTRAAETAGEPFPAWKDVRDALVAEALRRAGGSPRGAARLMRVGHATIYRIMDRNPALQALARSIRSRG